MNSQELQSAFAATLCEYLAQPNESGLSRAYELGRQALQLNDGLDSLAAAFIGVIHAELAATGSPEAHATLATQAKVFLIEAVQPYEMLLSGYREAARNLGKQFAEIKVLQGLLPICASCKEIRDDKGTWWPMETYLKERSEAAFTHGICPKCGKEFYGDMWDEVVKCHDDSSRSSPPPS